MPGMKDLLFSPVLPLSRAAIPVLFLQVFEQTMRDDMRSLQTAIRLGSRRAILHHAHRMKGVLAIVESVPGVRLCMAIERLAEERRHPARMAVLADALECCLFSTWEGRE